MLKLKTFSQLQPEGFSCYFDFSGSEFVCQARMLGWLVARHKGNSEIIVMLLVDKYGGIAVEALGFLYVRIKLWLI